VALKAIPLLGAIMLYRAGPKAKEIRLKNKTTRLSPAADQAFAISIEMNFARLSPCWRQLTVRAAENPRTLTDFALQIRTQ